MDSLHLVSAGLYQCIALNPDGNATSSYNLTIMSAVEPHFYPSLVVGSYTVLFAIMMGKLCNYGWYFLFCFIGVCCKNVATLKGLSLPLWPVETESEQTRTYRICYPALT